MAFSYTGDKDLKIVLIGSNSIRQVSDDNIEVTNSFGMQFYNYEGQPTITITGESDASLEVEAGTARAGSLGLYGCDKLVVSGPTVSFTGGTTKEEGFGSLGAYLFGGYEVTGGKLIAKGNNQAIYNKNAIQDSNVRIEASENIDGTNKAVCEKSELDDKKYVEITALVEDSTGSESDGTSDTGNSDTSGGTSSDTSNDTAGSKVPYEDVPIDSGYVKDITGTAAATAESNPFETKIVNNSELKTLLSLTDAEVAQGVNVWLDIQDMSASVPQADKTLIQNTSGDYTVGLYLDINLFKKVGSNNATKVTETNGKVKVSILIPESLWKSGRTFEIIRVHDGVATAIAGTYDENTHVFTFETDKFSTYALAYKDPASSSDSGTTSDSSSSNSSNSTESTAPKTGDPNDIRVWYLLLIASIGGLGFLGYSKKKKVND